MKIYIASHKYTDLPYGDIYSPLYVGSSRLPSSDRKIGWEYDDTCSKHISNKNGSYCELTGLYWIWKQSHEDIVGLVHYRRFFQSPSDPTSPISEQEIRSILQSHDCIVASDYPCSSPRNNELISTGEQYRLVHSSSDLVQLSLVLKRFFPAYHKSFLDLSIHRNTFAPCNMIICSKKLLNEYATWLFKVLSHLEKRIDPITGRNQYQQRVFGFLAERLLNVFIATRACNPFPCDIFDPAKPHIELNIPKSNWPIPKPIIQFDIPSVAVLNKIDYSDVFSYRFYLTHNSDIAIHYSNNPREALEHFLLVGINEGRMAHPRFSIESYINGNPHLREQFGDNRILYLEYYLSHPKDRHHAVGCENLWFDEPDDKVKDTLNLIDRAKHLRFQIFLRLAEQQDVLD